MPANAKRQARFSDYLDLLKAFVELDAGPLIAIGVFFGFYPAHKAAALNPIDALRYEQPWNPGSKHLMHTSLGYHQWMVGDCSRSGRSLDLLEVTEIVNRDRR